MSAESHPFRTELKQVLDIIIHSLYSNKEIFLRELISNAADAIDKIRFDAISRKEDLGGDLEWKIEIIPDEQARTLTVRDNGLGMDREDLVQDLGTIARSGTQEFLRRLQEADEERRPELIGQFGVGFYSAFMVADEVSVVSRKAGTDRTWRWTSRAEDSFTLEPAAREGRGTDVVLTLKEEEKEFLEPFRLRGIAKRFSDYIEHPVVLVTPKRDKEGKEVIPGEFERETLNARQAIWLHPPEEVKQKEYDEFYKHLSHDPQGPFRTIHYAAEGALDFKALLFLPRQKPFDLFFREKASGLHLYVKRVFIMDDCEKLIPRYLDFIKGVVDSSDLPLNVSREMLQEDRELVRIRKALVKKVLGTLKEIREKEYDDYVKFWEEFGQILKAGVTRDFENKERLAELMLFASTHRIEGKYVTLDQYVEAMPQEQEEILYMVGETREMVENSPYMEHFREKDREVLIMTDPVDELVLSTLLDYKGKKLKAIDKGVPVGEEKEEELAEARRRFGKLLSFLGTKLKGVKEVRLSGRLKESASCLVGEEGSMGVQMERIMKEMGQDPPAQEKFLELNPDHPAVQKMLELYEQDRKDPRVEDYGRIFQDQAVLAAGGRIKDPAAFSARINGLLARS